MICRLWSGTLSRFTKMFKRNETVSIEGLIGCGKSTLLDSVENYIDDFNYLFVHEPVEDFKRCKLLNHEYNPLKEFYNDQNGNAVAFLSWVNKCYQNQLENLSSISEEHHKILMERCSYSSIIFIRSLNRLKIYSDFSADLLENDVLNTIRKYYGEEKYGVDKIYFINAPIDICVERILERNRTEENNIEDLKRYLTVLDIEYKLFLCDFMKRRGNDKVRIFFHPDLEVVKRDYLQFIKYN